MICREKKERKSQMRCTYWQFFFQYCRFLREFFLFLEKNKNIFNIFLIVIDHHHFPLHDTFLSMSLDQFFRVYPLESSFISSLNLNTKPAGMVFNFFLLLLIFIKYFSLSYLSLLLFAMKIEGMDNLVLNTFGFLGEVIPSIPNTDILVCSFFFSMKSWGRELIGEGSTL